MWKRIGFSGLGVILFFFAPWWVMFIHGMLGVLFFNWYLEMIVFGIAFDCVFGSHLAPWYSRLIHTIVFSIPVIGGEFLKRNMLLERFYEIF